MKTIINPILPGFYPDPSICRAGDNYYMVTSSFEFYPGIPVFQSKDLVNWRQIGHVLDRPSQLDLDGVKPSQGIYASTIRYHQGKFYVITTLVKDPSYYGNVNFFVTAEKPEGPWSEPIVIEGAPGIDSSLFFDDDDKAYYTGNLRPNPEEPASKARHIWLQEIDTETGVLKGERSILLKDGAMRNAPTPEGPHLYKINGFYYLLIAEGGTSHNHAVSIFRSKNITGPYEPDPGNPIMTHRHLGLNYPINSTGHGDLVQTQKGEWWMVMLASRPDGGYYRNLGRETFIAPVKWEDGWPIVSPGSGRVEFNYEAPDLEECRWHSLPACDSFEGSSLDYRWNFLRTPRKAFYSLTERKGYLRLKLMPEVITDLCSPAFIGRRQQNINFSARTAMEFIPKEPNEACGIIMLQNNRFHIRMEYSIKNGKKTLFLVKCYDGTEEILAEAEVAAERLYLKIEAYSQDYSFYFAKEPEQWQTLGSNIDGRLLSREIAGGFTGAYIGLYATSRGQESPSFGDFDWFEYIGL